MTDTDIMPHRKLTKLVSVWEQACRNIRTAYELLDSTSESLRDVFENTYRFDLRDQKYRFDEPDKTINDIKNEVWECLIDRMELRKVLSVKRRQELDGCLRDGKLEDGSPLPDITEDAILNMLRSFTMNLEGFMEQAVKEVFAFLRPRGWLSLYKTNTEFEVKKRCILHCVERRYSGD